MRGKLVYKDYVDGPYTVTDVPHMEDETIEGGGYFRGYVLYALAGIIKRMREEGIDKLPYDGRDRKEP